MWLLAAAASVFIRPAQAACDDTCTATICPGDLTITEFMADPSYESNYNAEWFEIHNATTRNLDLNGLVVGSDADSGFTVLTSLLVPAGEYVVFGVNANTATNGGITVDYPYSYFTQMRLQRAADSISLSFAGALIDEVVWNNGSGWGVTQNYSHHVNLPIEPLSWANDLAHNWCASVTIGGSGSGGSWRGTPGVANSQLCNGSSSDDDGDGYSEVQGDCDDADSSVNPGAIDGDAAPFGRANDDADCDGVIDDGACDDDGDGYAEIDGDCDDDLNAVNPGESEIIDGVDNDCNGCIDDTDDDNDGVSECDTGEVVDCDPDDGITCDPRTFDPFDAAGPVLPNGYREGACAVAYDTNDANNLIKPCAAEIFYDGIDQSGDGFDACDYDGDGYDSEECIGNPDPGFWDDRPRDCDDNDPTVFPGGDEGDPADGGIKDGKDNDCNGVVDDPFKDADGDGFDITQGDCWDDAVDPRAADVNPGAAEICGDGIDNDCNGMVDDGCSSSLGYTSVRGGGLCAAVPGDGRGLGALGVAGLLLLTSLRRRRDGEG